MNQMNVNSKRTLLAFCAIALCTIAFGIASTQVAAVTYTKNMENRGKMNDWGYKDCWDLHLKIIVNIGADSYIASYTATWWFEDLDYGNWNTDITYAGADVDILETRDQDQNLWSVEIRVKQKIVRTDVSDQWFIIGARLWVGAAGNFVAEHYSWDHNIPWYHYAKCDITTYST